jgi:hypothetical protein
MVINGTMHPRYKGTYSIKKDGNDDFKANKQGVLA